MRLPNLPRKVRITLMFYIYIYIFFCIKWFINREVYDELKNYMASKKLIIELDGIC